MLHKVVIELKNNPSDKISAKSAVWLPSYGIFAPFVLYIKSATFGNVAKIEGPYLGIQSTDLAEILAVGFSKDSIRTF